MKTENLIKWLIIVVVILIIGLGGVSFYQYSGLKHYIKAVKYINELPAEANKQEAWKYFAVDNIKNGYEGIYAGDYFGRVWVWGQKGLKSFATDKASVYSFFDGCTDEFFQVTDKFVPAFNHQVFFDKEKWKDKASVGDFVNVTLQKEVAPGFLKEIYTYNFWPFIQKDQRTECAK